jgi:DNA-binding NarL/FixJ family response regulator
MYLMARGAPLADGGGAMSKPSSRTSGALAPARKVRVVLVDDCTRFRDALARWLGLHTQARVTGQAGNGTDGFALAARLQPDLVITDFQMPGVDGLELVEMLRQEYPAMRTILTSAQDGPALRASSRRRGADAFVLKQRLAEELPRLLTRLFPDHAKG